MFCRSMLYALFILSVTFAGCGGGGGGGGDQLPAQIVTPPPSSGTPQTYRISGSVRHFQTGTPLAGATVTLATNSGSVSAVTDASGIYSFLGLVNGSYQLTPAHGSNIFFPVSQVVTLNGADSTCDFTYSDTSGRVVGLVADNGGNPQAPITVEVYQNGNLFSSRTNDSDGSFALFLPAGTYSLKIVRQNFIPLIYENVVTKENENTYLEMMFLLHTSFSGAGDISGRISNALDGNGVNDLTVKLRQGINVTSGPVFAATTTYNDGDPADPKKNGAYSFMDTTTGAFTIPGGNYTAEVSGTGFTPVFFSVRSLGGLITPNQNMTVAPEAASDLVRIVLTWFTKGDLDSHLTGPTATSSRFHIYYVNKAYTDAATTASLDVDNTVAYGPETTTPSKRTAGVYRFSVHDFTNLSATTSSALSRSGAQVRVYKGSALLQLFNVPVGRPGTLWTVFELDGSTAALTPVNRMTYQAAPSGIQ